MLVAPSDHIVPDAPAFRAAVNAGVPASRAGDLVTLGIKPTHLETGYGHLELAEDPGSFAAKPLGLSRFVEKPDATRDSRGVATSGHVTALDCDNTLLRSEDDGLEVVGIGLQNIIAVAMPDAVLVADSGRAQDVKHAVTALKSKQAIQATTFPKDHRPWGWFESLVIGDRFQVKRIYVHPGAALSLQAHNHRAEHWIVVEGTAQVTVDDTVQLVSENQAVYVPLGAKHRLENPGKVPMVLIEVQTGSYLGEDDIVRYEDMYARN